MSFVVIAFCFAIQWFLNVGSASYQWHWSSRYVGWMQKTFSSLMKGHGAFTLLILVLPILIVTSLILTAVYHLLGHIGYLIVSLALLWYCVDIIELRTALTKSMSAETVVLQSFRKIFSPLMWYFFTGPVGLVFSVVVYALSLELPNQKYFTLAANAVDWVPVRLLGLTFALVGNFGAVFKVWMKELLQPITEVDGQIIAFAQAAVGADRGLVLSEVVTLLYRAVLVWLVLAALFGVSGWIG
jgi:AmpE protein